MSVRCGIVRGLRARREHGYGGRLRRLAALRLDIVHSQAKFKDGPPSGAEAKRQVVNLLRARNQPNDARAADVIESSMRASAP